MCLQSCIHCIALGTLGKWALAILSICVFHYWTFVFGKHIWQTAILEETAVTWLTQTHVVRWLGILTAVTAWGSEEASRLTMTNRLHLCCHHMVMFKRMLKSWKWILTIYLDKSNLLRWWLFTISETCEHDYYVCKKIALHWILNQPCQR